MRLPCAFASLGWDCLKASQQSICLESGQACVLREGTATPLHTFDLVWHLGLGDRRSFLDRMELLSMLPNRLMVTPPSALALRHGKLHIHAPLLAHMLPKTHASSDIDYLVSKLDEGEWVVKPAAGSFGRGVHRVHTHMPNLRETLFESARGGLLVLQKHISTKQPETRVLFAEGEPVGRYGRKPGADGLSNLARGAAAVKYELEPRLVRCLTQVGGWLKREGIGFAAADFRGGYLIEINIANPGGLATVQALTGKDASIRVATALAHRGMAAGHAFMKPALWRACATTHGDLNNGKT